MMEDSEYETMIDQFSMDIAHRTVDANREGLDLADTISALMLVIIASTLSPKSPYKDTYRHFLQDTLEKTLSLWHEALDKAGE